MGKTVLIVDDDPKNLKLVRDLLQLAGYETLEAVNGEEAVRLAREEQPDLILMDVQMPVMDGVEATRILKGAEETKEIPVVCLSALAMAEDKKGQADLINAQIKMKQTDANIANEQAKRQIDAFSEETERMAVQVDAQEAGATIKTKRIEAFGKELDNVAKTQQISNNAFRGSIALAQ